MSGTHGGKCSPQYCRLKLSTQARLGVGEPSQACPVQELCQPELTRRLCHCGDSATSRGQVLCKHGTGTLQSKPCGQGRLLPWVCVVECGFLCLVGLGGAALLKELHHWGWALGFKKPIPFLGSISALFVCLSVCLTMKFPKAPGAEGR